MKGTSVIYAKYVKRIIDFIIALLGLTIFSPILLIITLVIRKKLGSPVLFKQKRPGKDGKIFWMYKFRSMTDVRDANGKLLPDGERLTNFGKRLRTTSLDELPELFNVLKGEMSLVGPRPLLVEYLERYSESEMRRHEVKPGITGLAQINGRNSICWEEKFQWDINYVDHITWWGDMQIIGKTFLTVFAKRGISSQTSETMELFVGTHKGDNTNESE